MYVEMSKRLCSFLFMFMFIFTIYVAVEFSNYFRKMLLLYVNISKMCVLQNDS